ncbi:hypothetical protein ACQ7A6_08535, partial [Klebsiella pneumoniae]|uniref:hypothetical protein n=1 Tax=Klebsiella pneumoniae TaxID=573 RepID=UPI003D353DA0
YTNAESSAASDVYKRQLLSIFKPSITQFSLTISLLHRRSVANSIAIPFAPPPTTPDYITIKTKFGRI